MGRKWLFSGIIQQPLIRYFMQTESISKDYIHVLDNKVLGAIEQLYFTTSKQRKMLLDVGIYERDIDAIVRIIGEDYEDAFAMKKLLKDNIDNFQRISYISKYIIGNL